MSTKTGTDHVQASFFDAEEHGPVGSNVAEQTWNPAAVGLDGKLVVIGGGTSEILGRR